MSEAFEPAIRNIDTARHISPKPSSGSAFAIALGGLVALAVGIGVGRFVYTPILPFMTEALGLTPAESGLIASSNFLGHLLGALAAVRARMRGGHRRWLLGALALSAATTAAMGLTTAMAAFIVLRFAGGVASALAIVLTTLGLINARRSVAGDPRRTAAVMTASFGLGQMICPTFAGYAYRIGDSFQIPSLAAAALTVRLRS